MVVRLRAALPTRFQRASTLVHAAPLPASPLRRANYFVRSYNARQARTQHTDELPRSFAHSLHRTVASTTHFRLRLPLTRPFSMTSRVSSAAPGWDLGKAPFPSVRRADTTFPFKSKANGGKEVQVADPYNYLETPPSQSKETKAFCDAQAAFTQQYYDQCKDKDEVRRMLDTVVNYTRYSVPRAEGAYDKPTYYYALNNGLDAQSTWYVASADELDAAEKNGWSKPAGKKFFDENLMSETGTVTVGNFYFSSSGKLAAYTVSQSGSDWYTVYFRDASKPFVDKPADHASAARGGDDRLPDVLKNVKFTSIQWTTDDKGVFYQRLAHVEGQDDGTEINVAKHAKVYYHRIGTTQDEDICVIDKDPHRDSNIWGAQTTDDGKWLVLSSFKGTEQKSRLYIASLEQPISSNMKWVSIAPKFEYYLNLVGNDGNDFYFMTNKDAPNWKIVRARVDTTKASECGHVTDLTEEAVLEDVVKEDKDATMDGACVVDKNKLLVWYIKEVKHELYQFELKTGNKIQRLLPNFIGTVSSVSARPDDHQAFVSVVSFTTPGFVYRLAWDDDGKDALAVPKTIQHRATKVNGLDPQAYVTRQVFVPSNDGAKVPVYLTYHKDTPMDGTAPAWLYFYGGFAHSLMPTFSPRLLSWLGAYGGVLVWVNARGGSEYGEEWHEGGNFFNKQNTFNDVLGAAQYIVDEKIAAKGKIIVNGGSNGGMGAMAVGNQAPEGLLGAVLADVGVHDMLRFSQFTAGTFWTQEYGDPQDEAMFDYLYNYSPLHTVKSDKTYPLVLLCTADHDDRVSPLHTFKMIAELQHRRPNNANPLLLRVTSDAGHGASNSLTKVLEEATFKYCLVAHVLGLKRKPLPGSLPASKQ